MRTIYRDVETINRREVVTVECDCDRARRERLADKPVHRAFRYADDWNPGAINQYVCTKTSMTVHL